jgi:hypothetical protein
MPDGIDTRVQTMQPSRVEPVLNRPFSEPQRSQLSPSHDPMLLPGKLRIRASRVCFSGPIGAVETVSMGTCLGWRDTSRVWCAVRAGSGAESARNSAVRSV